MNREDLGALKNLYEGLQSSPLSETDKPTVTKTITTGLDIYESQIQNTKTEETASNVLSEEVETVTKITASTPSTTPLKNTTGTFSEASWGTMSTVKDIADIYSNLYEKKDQDKDGDNDFDDVRIARMIASGMSREEAMKKVKEDPKGDEVKEETEQVDEATAMAKRGYDETAIRSKIAKSTGGGKSADRATDLEDKETYGNKKVAAQRQNLARKQRTDFRKTTSSNPGLHGYGHKSNDPAVKAKQAARGAQRGVLTPNEKKSLNREEFEMPNEYEVYNVVSTYLLENNFAESQESADAIIENMSSEWVEQVIEEYNEYVDEYNLFLEELDAVGVDLDEWTDEELEEAYKKLPFRKMVKQAKKTGKSLDDVMKVSKDHNPSRVKGRSEANKMAGAITGGRAADRNPPKADKSKDEPGGYGDMSKYTGDIYAKKFKPGKTVPKVMKFGRPFGKYKPRSIKFDDIKKQGLD